MEPTWIQDAQPSSWLISYPGDISLASPSDVENGIGGRAYRLRRILRSGNSVSSRRLVFALGAPPNLSSPRSDDVSLAKISNSQPQQFCQIYAPVKQAAGRHRMPGRREQDIFCATFRRRELASGRIDRREFMMRRLVAGLRLAGVAATWRRAESRFGHRRPIGAGRIRAPLQQVLLNLVMNGVDADERGCGTYKRGRLSYPRGSR